MYVHSRKTDENVCEIQYINRSPFCTQHVQNFRANSPLCIWLNKEFSLFLNVTLMLKSFTSPIFGNKTTAFFWGRAHRWSKWEAERKVLLFEALMGYISRRCQFVLAALQNFLWRRSPDHNHIRGKETDTCYALSLSGRLLCPSMEENIKVSCNPPDILDL